MAENYRGDKTNLCKCSCGTLVHKDYARGHYVRENGTLSDEHKKKLSERLSGENNPNFGKKHSEETKEKIRQKRLGKSWTSEQRESILKVNEEKRESLRKEPTLCACECGEYAEPGRKYIQHHHHRNRSEETKKKMSESHKGQPSWQTGLTAADDPRILSGEKHGRWKGGIHPFEKTIRQSSKYSNWRTGVFERDNYTCQRCFKRGVRLQAHHIVWFSTILIENNIKSLEESLDCQELWDLDNGATLCKKCHKQQHN